MRLAVPLALGIVAQASCMQTGREWVHAPFDDGDDARSEATPFVASMSPAAPRVEPAKGSGRIRKTITLGETTTPTTTLGAPSSVIYDAPPSEAAPYREVYVVPYAWRAPTRVGPSQRAPSHPSGGANGGGRPGEDWPKPPSYGPAFPFSTAPASPWRR